MSASSQTKRTLAEALKALMARQPFQKISVGDICETCGMSRKSFYYHFQDKYDLVNWIFYVEFVETLCAPDHMDGLSMLNDICHYLYREQIFYRNALCIRGQNCFQDYFTEVIRPFIRIFVQEAFADHEENASFFVQFYSDAFLSAVIRWLNEGTPLPPKQFAALLVTAITQPHLPE